MAVLLFAQKEIRVKRNLRNKFAAIQVVHPTRLLLLLVLLFLVNVHKANAAINSYNNGEFANDIQPTDCLKDQIGSLTMSESLETPNIIVRFANPTFDCVTGEYCLDVEFQSDIPDQELFGMNVRFFCDASILELIDFRDFQGGYSPIAPNPPTVITSLPGFGYNFFRFGDPGIGAADWVNGAIQLSDENQAPIYISTAGWTKLFQVCFAIDDPDPDSLHFCPSVVWDLEVNPANGGFLAGDDGVVMTVVAPAPEVSAPANENVEQFNWEYTGNGGAPPYGQPVETSCIPILVDATINGSTEPGCYFTDRTFQPLQPELSGATYLWDFGEGAVPSTATGYGPHTVYYDTVGNKTVSLVIYPPQGGAQCGDSSSVMFVINSCPANIVGRVSSTVDEPIAGVNVKLYADTDVNGMADNNILVKSVFTNSQGDYSMASLIPGNYVIIQTQPNGWQSFDDGDATPDNDIVANIDALDNLIPVTLAPGELDLVNYFVETASPGNITGAVFNDFDGDQSPDAIEGLPDVTVKLFVDANANGVADGNIALSTQVTASTGNYVFSNVPVGHYVVVETNLVDYTSIKDIDPTNDGDAVQNTNTQNDTIPVTIGNGETDANNYFIDASNCSLLVTSLGDSGPGTLRDAIACAENGDTIRFLSNLEGLNIIINSGRILIDKSIYIRSDCINRIAIKSEIVGLFDISPSATVEFKLLNIISGYSGNVGAAFNNMGNLHLEDINVFKNPLLPPGEYLLRNGPESQLFLKGNCFLEVD